VPPELRTLRSLGADAVIVDLADEKHRAFAALGNLVVLNPKGHTIQFALVLGGFADDLDDVWVVLLLAEQQLKWAEPTHADRSRMKLDKDDAVSAAKDLEEAGIHCNRWAAQFIGRDWNDCLHTSRAESPNDPKLFDTPERRGACMVGGPPARTRFSKTPEAHNAGRGGNMATKVEAEAATVTRRHVRRSAWLGAFSLNERMSKSLLGVVVGWTEAVNVVSNLVNENVIEIEGAKVVNVLVASVVEEVSAKKDARPPIVAVAVPRTRPTPLLLTCAREKKNRAKSGEVFGWHSIKAPLHLFTRTDMDKIRL
jgi:hypothetical protein